MTDKIITPRIVKAPQLESYPTTSSQKNIWTLCEFGQKKSVCSITSKIHFIGLLDLSLLQKALSLVVEHNEILRTIFIKEENSDLKQKILPVEDLEIAIEIHSSSNEKEISLLIEKHADHVFNLDNAPLLKLTVITVTEKEYLMLINIHALISDKLSLQLIFKEIVKCYNNLKEGIKAEVVSTKIQHKDFSYWRQKEKEFELIDNNIYWKKQFEGDLPTIDFPNSKSKSQAKKNINIFQHTFKSEFASLLRIKALEQNTTMFIGLLAGLNALLYRYGNKTDTLIGTKFSDRDQFMLEAEVGSYLNPVAVRTHFEHTDTYDELIQKQKKVVSEGFKHRDYSFEVLSNNLGLDVKTSILPIFDFVVLFENQAEIFDMKHSFEGATISNYEIQNRNLNCADITFCFFEDLNDISVSVNYNSELYDLETIQRFLTNYEFYLINCVRSSSLPISKVDCISPDERQSLIYKLNQTKVSYDSQKTILDDFLVSVAAHSTEVAIKFEDSSITYLELNNRSNQLARHLISKNIKSDDVIALGLDRGIELVIGILGILKSGGVYLPLKIAGAIEKTDEILAKSKAKLVLTNEHVYGFLSKAYEILKLEETCIWEESIDNLPFIDPLSQAYIMFTSGTTGDPKGVTISHQNLKNLFVGLNEKFGEPQKKETWLASTDISFDISLLELLWTLTRGSEVIIQPESQFILNKTNTVDFSLFYFAAQEEVKDENKYSLLLRGANYADQNGLKAIWVPERHFHSFGDQFPNPSIAAAAVAATTKNVVIRSGSVVVPLHDPVRIAEEWSMVDNLSDGRVELSVATGWNPNDFVLKPEAYENRHEIMKEGVTLLKKLWKGDIIERKNGIGNEHKFKIHPRPIQQGLQIWITVSGRISTFRYAGSIGANILTHLLGQDIEDLEEKIAAYRDALTKNGFNAEMGKVALMLHTFIGEDPSEVQEIVKEPFKNYLRNSIGLMKPLADAAGLDINKDIETLVETGFNRFYKSSGLFGTIENCFNRVKQLSDIGINEIACLIDYGIDSDTVISSLENVKKLKETIERYNAQYAFLNDKSKKYTTTSQLIKNHKITHLQSTPSLLQDILKEEEGRESLRQIKTLLVGGDQLPEDLANSILSFGDTNIYNMYGPTETTIWSTIKRIEVKDDVTIGEPIANTQIYILDEHNELCPRGGIGELCISGNGVSQSYIEMYELTKEKFITNIFDDSVDSLIYRTGDIARWQSNGEIQYLGRLDDQLKINGNKVQLNEIKDIINGMPEVLKSVITFKNVDGGKKLVCYLKIANKVNSSSIQKNLKLKLHSFMIPYYIIVLNQIPLTSKGNIAYDQLPLPSKSSIINGNYKVPKKDFKKQLTDIWKGML